MVKPQNQGAYHKSFIGIGLDIGLDFIPNDFHAFSETLRQCNLDVMNSSGVALIFGITKFNKKYYLGFNFGTGKQEDDGNDSLTIVFKTRLYELNFGYYLINSHRFRLSPTVAIK
ncbi:MAG: hypothetical protein Q8M08_10245 [Bacteroidales bacterium]|nr:hypothetical protein [Bacteroidales bacterium]